MAAAPAKPPEEVPAEIKEDVAKLQKPLAAILVGKEIPWVIQAALGASRWKTWRIAETPRRRLGTMVPGTWDSRMERMGSTPRPRPSRRCASFRQFGWQPTWSGGATKVTIRRARRARQRLPWRSCVTRRQLEDAYVATHGTPKPRLEFQGSDGYLKKQWRMIAKGELGYIPAKHIVSALPEEGERFSSTHKKITVDGWDREDEEEVRSHPTSRRQLERLHLTFRTTLLMCTAARVTKEELDDWYAWFYGEDIAGRKPPPSDTTLLFAERNVWRKIHEMVHQGTTLSEALKNIRGDFLFWQREVYEHLNRAPEKGKSKSKAPKVWQTQWEKPKKGGKGSWPLGPTRSKPKGKGGKGKSPNTSSTPWPDHWAFKNPKGVAYFRDHAADPTTPRSGRMGGCVMPPHRSMCHSHAHTFPSDRRPLRVP